MTDGEYEAIQLANEMHEQVQGADTYRDGLINKLQELDYQLNECKKEVERLKNKKKITDRKVFVESINGKIYIKIEDSCGEIYILLKDILDIVKEAGGKI